MTIVEAPPVNIAKTPSDPRADVPRSINVKTIDDQASLFGSAIGSLGLVWVIYENILAFSGIIGFAVAWWVVFLVLYAGVTVLGNPLPVVVDRVAGAVVASGAVVVGGVLVWVIFYTFYRGWPALHHLNFFTHNMTGVRPTAPLTQGGVWFTVVGSAEQVGMATLISLPLGIGTAIFLAEVGGSVARVVRTVVEAMTALPDILAGLFVYTFLILALGWQRDGIAVALALSVTMTPIIARAAEVVLRVVPGGLREASLALGASTWQTVWRVVLPTARSGLVTSLILGIARVAGESAPLLIVSAPTTFFNANPTNEPQTSLPLFIYTQIRSGEKNAIIRGYGAAALLLTLVLTLFIIARIAARDRVGGGRGRLRSFARRGVRPTSPPSMSPAPPPPPAWAAHDAPTAVLPTVAEPKSGML
jgi:phosphate transport system permease protein